ncbi:MAG: hypothetical protein KH301_01130 [Brachyspira sp.]|nr:hypothetical protein [Brachyspira sp.]
MAKIQKVISQTAQISRKLTQLKSDIVFSSVLGNYKDYKNAKKAYAELAKDNFELSMQAKGPKVERVPLFSKAGMGILKVLFLDMFRVKTPAEKEFSKLVKLEKAKQKFNIQG